jgi:hypothetical protein
VPEYPSDEFDVDYPPGARRGAHRTATPAWLDQLPWLLAALAAVVVLVLVVGWVTGGGPTSPLGSPSSDPSASEPATTDPATTDPATTDPATTDPATTDPPTTDPPTTTEAPTPTADRSLELVVLNGTSTSGLAAGVGEELEELGWSVGELGNADDRPVESTVVLFSAAEHEATAAAVASDLGAEARLDDGATSAVVVVVGEDRA